ncbi:glycosyl transferase, group 2 family protein [Phenylobacterium zucineum HLK1]|uniref:Glycosyl transferase, group 2 family protein n=1 Tax=Phenylobacterium zucineum (strain HLK1) TaxID=450851 RepID=B4R831_PHEZH|nr:glycosyltransferase family 2 protein [Phenylobacterium zucineum]ACG77564.1 glycosyl transferase, group 2 family protein [Phenylobacterium zucineum HLK1]
MAATTVDVAVCTYRRPAVAETLASIARQALAPDVRVRVIVADNDEQPEARARVLAAAKALALEVAYVHAPARNISLARNACLEAAEAPFLAFIDDDETASEGWLAALLAEAEAGGWDAVLGPVRAVYGPQAPPWMAAGDFHSTRPVQAGGRILKGYAGNVLVRRETVERLGLRFDLALGRQGGEDDDFFYRLTDAGGTIGYAPDALAFEPVPEQRASLKWLLKRSFRTGQTHGSRLRRRSPGAAGRLVQSGLAAAKGGVCLAGAAASAFSPARRGRWLVRGALHAGVVARLAGWRELQLY